MKFQNLSKYTEKILYSGNKFDGNITVEDITNFKTLRATIDRGTPHRNCITLYVSELIKLRSIVIDISGGGGTIKYISNTQLNIVGGGGYFLEIVGINF